MANADGVTGGCFTVAVAGSERPGTAFEVALQVTAGTTVLDAIRASGVLERFPALDVSTAAVGIWGRASSLTVLLRPGDRVEIYRPLAIDPKEARRKRALEVRDASRRKGSAARP